MFKQKLSEWSMLPAEVEVTHFYGIWLTCGQYMAHLSPVYGSPVASIGLISGQYRAHLWPV
jgi:hypothetical protein